MKPQDITDFWLDLPDEVLFRANDDFDAGLRSQFGDIHAVAVAGELDDWAQTRDGRLALILLLDQMSRNLKRGTPAMFAADKKALALAVRAIELGDDALGDPSLKRWYYMPFMHSELLADQERCVELCSQPGMEATLPFAIEHRDIIARFGRFPHRNKVLGRPMRDQEQAYLEKGGFAG